MISDNKQTRLIDSGYGVDSRQVNDMEVQWLKTATSWQAGDPSAYGDLWRTFLDQRSFDTGNNADDLYAYLDSLGYNLSDHLQDRLSDFWADSAPL